jgi:hypothetical protein
MKRLFLPVLAGLTIAALVVAMATSVRAPMER